MKASGILLTGMASKSLAQLSQRQYRRHTISPTSAKLVDHIRSTGASAIFLETGTNPALAEQISKRLASKL
jgi:ABC-type Zn uptake system ZnuABC Zn-binding protein ZnuA